jgi:hypothetical protein
MFFVLCVWENTGFVQAVYTSDGSNSASVSAWETWAAGGTSPPHQTFTNTSSADSSWLLQTMHQSMIAAHEVQLEAAGLLAEAKAMLPTEAHLLLWDPKTEGFGNIRNHHLINFEAIANEMTEIELFSGP